MYIMCLSKGLDAIAGAIDAGLLPHKQIGFIPTAGETYKDPYFVEESRARLRSLRLTLIELNVTTESKDQLLHLLSKVDAIYIAGGNSFYLLQQLQKKGLIPVIRKKVEAGMPYFGESAGAVILYKTIEPIKPLDDPQDAPGLLSYESLNLIEFIPLPHFDKQKYRELFTNFYNSTKDQYPIVPFNDDQAIIVDSGGYRIVPSPISTIGT